MISRTFEQGCTNLGTKATDSNGECVFDNTSFAGEPEICNVQSFDLQVNELECAYYYASHIRVLKIFITS